MKRSWYIKFLILTLIFSLTIPLFACVESGMNDPETAGNTDSETPTSNDGSETGDEYPSESGDEKPTDESPSEESSSNGEDESNTTEETEPQVPSNVTYKNGPILKGTGASFAKDAFATTERYIDTPSAVTKSAEEILAVLKNKSATADNVYKTTEKLVFDANTTYNGNGAAIIAEGGVEIKGEKVVLKDVVIIGNVNVIGATDVTLYHVDIRSEGTALTIDQKSNKVTVEECRFTAKDLAVNNDASNTSVYNTYLKADKGVMSTGDGLCVQVVQIDASTLGVSSSGAYAIIKNCRIEADENGLGIEFAKGSYNSMSALNIIRDAQLSIKISEGYNCSLILNCAIRIEGRNNKNLYVIKNSLGGYIDLEDNNYLICDGNTYVKDTNSHQTLNKNNKNYNGDGLHDVDARLEVGADEDLLPHTNKDLFIGMERQNYVKDLSLSKNFDLSQYIQNVKRGGTLIVPPGVYSVKSGLTLSASNADCEIYAYGAYLEATDYVKLIYVQDTSNISINGLTVGYVGISGGQLHVLKNLGNQKFLVISSAGFGQDFGATDSSRFVSTGSGAYFYHENEFTSWTELGAWGGYKIVKNADGSTFNKDGTFTIEITGSQAAKYSSLIKPGEMLACRLNEGNDRTMHVSDCKTVLFKDMVLYGYSDAMTLISGGLTEGVQLYRHHNTAHSAPEIDKATYEKYEALEKQYNVNLDISIDEEGRYRGSSPRIGSMDASHSIAAIDGISATSTLFENACDDASNQRGDSSLLHEVIDNKDGTTTLVLKYNISSTYYNLYKNNGATQASGTYAREFKKGDEIFIYGNNGKIFCDTTTVSDQTVYNSKYVMLDEDYTAGGHTIHWTWTCPLYAVKVNTADINMSALSGINYKKNGPEVENKVFVDNMSRNSEGFTFDNCMVRHNRGRVLPKTRNVTIKNCSFVDTSYAGIVLSSEISWGESSIPSNITIQNCLFDGTSKTFNMQTNTKYAAIAVEGLGATGSTATVSKDTLPAMNINIIGNVFRNVRNNYFITVSAAQGVTIKDNTFETGSVTSENMKVNTKAILINGCMNVDISGNNFPDSIGGDTSKVIVAKNFKELHGDDVEKFFPANSAN